MLKELEKGKIYVESARKRKRKWKRVNEGERDGEFVK